MLNGSCGVYSTAGWIIDVGKHLAVTAVKVLLPHGNIFAHGSNSFVLVL